MENKSIPKNSVVRWDKVENRPRRIVGQIEVRQRRTSEETVRAFLTDNQEMLKLKTSRKDLKLVQNVESLIGRHLRFQQYLRGIPVYGGIVAVHLDKNGNVKQLNDDHELDSRVLPTAKGRMATRKEAEKIARDAITEPINLRPKARIKIERLYYPTDRGLRMSWCITIPTLNPPHHWRVFVDVYSREILAIDDMIDFSVEGEGLVFNPNPVVTANDNTFLDGVTSEATLNAEQVTGALHELEDPVNGQHYLRGPYVEIIDLAAPDIGIPSEADPMNFNYDRTNDNFEAVNIYCHIDNYQRLIQNDLVITSACPVTPPDTRIHADAHDNSMIAAWFDSGTKDLHFSDSGPGKPDRGEDGECMIHEYGHAILDHQITGWHTAVPGVFPSRYEARAIGEGFGDVSACLYFVQAGGGYQREVFEDWIFAPDGLRRVDHPTAYDDFLTGAGNHYANSEIWSGSIWDIFLAIDGDSLNANDWAAPRNELLKALITSHNLYTASESMPDAAEALIKTHCDLADQLGRHAIEMLDVFHDRKLLECDVGSDIRINQLWSQQDDVSIRSWETVEAGQDNWFYAEVTNVGTTAARALVVTFSFKCPFSTPVYPSDFRDNIISAAVEFDLDVGETKTVKACWPSELIPPIPTGADSLHGCIFAEVYNSIDHVPAGATTIGASNGKLRYRNTTIEDMVPDADADFLFNTSSYHIAKEQMARFEVIRPPKWKDMEISFHHHNHHFIKELWRDIEAIEAKFAKPIEEAIKTGAEVHVLEPTKIVMRSKPGETPLILNLARGSSLMVPDQSIQEADIGAKIDADFVRRDADLITSKTGSYLRLRPGHRVGLPYVMKPRDRATIKMRIKAPKDAKPGEQFTVEVIQRNTKGELIGGFDVQVKIVDELGTCRKLRAASRTRQVM